LFFFFNRGIALFIGLVDFDFYSAISRPSRASRVRILGLDLAITP
jgi:hypothetical protein